MNETARTLLMMVIITLVLMMVFKNFATPVVSEITYSHFLSEVKNGAVKSVKIEGSMISGSHMDDTRFATYSPETGNYALIGTLLEHNVEVKGAAPDNSLWAHAFITWLPFILIFGINSYI